MKAGAVALLLLFAPRAFAADDAPRIEPVEGGYFVNAPGMLKLNVALAGLQTENITLKAENESLHHDVQEAALKPVLTWKGAAVLLAVGAAVGAGLAVSICVAAR